MEKLKKIASIIVINIIILFSLLAILEFTCLIMKVNAAFSSMLNERQTTFKINNAKQLSVDYLRILKIYVQNCYLNANKENYIKIEDFRKPSIGSQYKNKNIVLAGCSFTYGDSLADEDTFSAELAKYAQKYKVYNIGICGSSPKEILYMLRNYEKYSKQNILPENTKDTKYFIYTYIYDHERRLVLDISDKKTPIFKTVKDENGNEHLEYIKPHHNIFEISFLVQYFRDKTYNEEHSDVMELYVKEIKREVEKIFPNAEFVMFVYEKPACIHSYIKDIEKSGIKVVNINDLSDIDFFAEEYQISDRIHPSEKAWKTIVPLLSERIGIK